MTIFGIDISNHQNPISLKRAAAEGMRFAIIKATEGDWKDPIFHSHLADARAAGMLTAAYHYVRAPEQGSTAAQQADAIATHIRDTSVSVWLDIEDNAGYDGSFFRELKEQITRRGYRVAGAYTGAWYWNRMPDKDLSWAGNLWLSDYGPNPAGNPGQLYDAAGGDASPRWNRGLGCLPVTILQYGSNGHVAGLGEVDVNAYRGSSYELQKLFSGNSSPTVASKGSPAVEKTLPYPRDHVKQDTGFNCGPASTQTVVLAATGKVVDESILAREMGTTVEGTSSIERITGVLGRRLAAGKYTSVIMPNDPPTGPQIEKLWADIRRSIDAGYGVVCNIVAPPSNYPRAVAPSTVSPAYGGGTVYHYLAAMGYGGEGPGRRVWIADSGFSPYGYWISLAQLASLIPPKGYCYSLAPAKHAAPSPSQKENIMEFTQTDRDRLAHIDWQLTGDPVPGSSPGWKQLGNRTIVDALAVIGEKLGCPSFYNPTTVKE